jgi:hypothetical protein
MIYGPPLGGIIPQTSLSALVALGYLGLIFIVFEGESNLGRIYYLTRIKIFAQVG